MAERAGKGGGARKYGKKSKQPAMARYTTSHRRDQNKAARIARMMKRFPKYKMPPGWKWSQERAGEIVRSR